MRQHLIIILLVFILGAVYTAHLPFEISNTKATSSRKARSIGENSYNDLSKDQQKTGPSTIEQWIKTKAKDQKSMLKKKVSTTSSGTDTPTLSTELDILSIAPILKKLFTGAFEAFNQVKPVFLEILTQPLNINEDLDKTDGNVVNYDNSKISNPLHVPNFGELFNGLFEAFNKAGHLANKESKSDFNENPTEEDSEYETMNRGLASLQTLVNMMIGAFKTFNFPLSLPEALNTLTENLFVNERSAENVIVKEPQYKVISKRDTAQTGLDEFKTWAANVFNLEIPKSVQKLNKNLLTNINNVMPMIDIMEWLNKSGNLFKALEGGPQSIFNEINKKCYDAFENRKKNGLDVFDSFVEGKEYTRFLKAFKEPLATLVASFNYGQCVMGYSISKIFYTIIHLGNNFKNNLV